MKLSEFMKEQIELVSDKFLLEVSDTKDAESRQIYFYKDRNTVWDTVKKISTVAACFALAIAAALTFILVGGSHTPNDTTPADAVETDKTAEILENYDYSTTISYETREEYGFIATNNANYAVWNDFVFYRNQYDDILYKNISAGPYNATSIFGDKEKSEVLPGDYVTVRNITVDRYASERNDGWPVLIIDYTTAIKNGNGFQSGAKIISYDMKTKTSTVLAESNDDVVFSYGIYGEYIFSTFAFTNQNRKTENNIYRIALDGSETIRLDTTDSYVSLYAIDDEYIYYYSFNNNDETLYRTTHDFKNSTEVCKVTQGTGIHAYGGYIYKFGGVESVNVDGETFWSVDLLKMDRENISEGEVIIENLNNTFQENNMLYYLKVEPTYYGGKLCKLKNVIYSYDFNTGEEAVVADMTDIEKEITIVGTSEQSLLLEMKEYTDGEMTGWDVYHYGLETQALTGVISYKLSDKNGGWDIESTSSEKISEEYGFIKANNYLPTTAWEDYIFYVTANDLIYDIRYESADGEKSIFEGAVDDEGILPGESAKPIFVIDQNASEDNGGMPVFIIAYNGPVKDERGDQTGTFGRVISYDMKTKKTVLLADNIDDGIFELGMYGRQVFVTGCDFEPGVPMCSTYNLYSISLATGKTVILDNPDKTRYDLITADENYVYFGESGTIYKATYNFGNVTEVCKVADAVNCSAYEEYFAIIGNH